jgi:translocator protein
MPASALPVSSTAIPLPQKLGFAFGLLLLGQLTNYAGGLLFGQTWYDGLDKPWFHPRSLEVFGLVFVINYLTMAWGTLVLIERRAHTSPELSLSALWLFAFHYLIGIFWVPSVYGTRSIGLGFAIDLLVDVIFAAAMVLYYKVSKRAFLWLLPTATWYVFTTYLKYVVWTMNS